MKYTVIVGSRSFVVDIEGDTVRLDERPVAVVRHAAGGPIRRLVVDNRSLEVVAAPGGQPGMWELSTEGNRLAALVVDERNRSIRMMGEAPPQAHQGRAVVVAPMPGLVVRVLVAPGDVVPAGAGLVVVEAMKMENELKAPADGTVERVHVSAGARVERGAPLVELG